MGERNVGATFTSAINGAHVHVFPLLDIAFSSGTQYLCGLDHPVAWAGNTYQPALGLMQIEPVRETGASYEGLRVTLAGVTTSSLALGLAEKMQGRMITLRMAAIDSAGVLRVDDNVWSGLLDVPIVTDEAEGARVVLQAEHRMATWDRPRVKRYTDPTLQKDYPGDLGLQYVAEMENAQLVWPSAEFFKQ